MTGSRPVRHRALPRNLHPGAWWLWGIGLATAASRTTNPLLLGLIITVAGVVVVLCRSDAPWAWGFRAYVYLGAFIVVVRIVFRMLLDGQHGDHVLFRLPEVPLPDAAAGIRIGGPVTLEGLLAAFYDGLRLATMLICIGAVNSLANPRRLLKSLPAALHEAGVAATVALSVAPQLVESGQRISRTRRLRGTSGKGRQLVKTVFVPLLTDALDRSLLLAAGMDARGYGRTTTLSRRERQRNATLVLLGLFGVVVGTYGVLDGTSPFWNGAPMLAAGLALSMAGFVLGGQRVQRSRYRPDPWRRPEWFVTAAGLGAAGFFVAASTVDVRALNPSTQPLEWPALSLLAVIGLAIAATPVWTAPAPPPDPQAT